MKKKQATFFTTRFSNKEELQDFLQKENTSYSNFILEKQKRPFPIKEKAVQLHHIQPLHANGSDINWNLIALTLDEHAEAHKLLFDCYKNYFDKCAYCMMKGNTAEALEAMRKQNQLNMKKKKVGFYDSKLQSELAQRPRKKRQPYARNIYILSALQKGFVLQSKETNARIRFQPGECKSLVEVLDKWLSHPEMDEKRLLWVVCKNPENFTLYTGLTRMLTGHRDKKTNKAVFSVAGWRIEGLFLPAPRTGEKRNELARPSSGSWSETGDINT